MSIGLRSLYHRFNTRFPALGKALRVIFLGERWQGYRGILHGEGNQIQAQGTILKNVELDVIGDHNIIQVGEGAELHNLKIRMRGSGHRLEIGRECRISRGGMFWFEDRDCLLKIGEKTTMVDVHIAVTEPGSRVTIGAECMFANDIDIRTGDSHSIIDASSGARLNFAEDIAIEDHVWVAAHTVVLKGVRIGADSVVATGSVVTHSCDQGVVLAGNPAKVIKTGISWKRERIEKAKDK